MVPVRKLPLAGALTLLVLAGCAVPRPVTPRGEPRGARQLLAGLQSALARRSVADLFRLFTVECRGGACGGFVPLPVGAEGRRVRARWTRRLDEGDLMMDLARALLSYKRIRVARVAPREWRSYYGLALVRAELVLEGEDREGRPLEDRGLLDLTLRETPAGWRIDRLVFARVERSVVLHAEEAEEMASEATGPSAPPASAPAPRPDEEEEEPAPPEQRSSEESAGDGAGSLLPANLLALTARGPAGEQPLRSRAGSQATLLLIAPARCPGCAALCRNANELLRGRPRCATLIVRLSAGGARGCGAELVAGARLRAALGTVQALLPLLVLLDGEGRIVRMVSGGAIGVELESDLAQRCR